MKVLQKTVNNSQNCNLIKAAFFDDHQNYAYILQSEPATIFYSTSKNPEKTEKYELEMAQSEKDLDFIGYKYIESSRILLLYSRKIIYGFSFKSKHFSKLELDGVILDEYYKILDCTRGNLFIYSVSEKNYEWVQVKIHKNSPQKMNKRTTNKVSSHPDKK